MAVYAPAGLAANNGGLWGNFGVHRHHTMDPGVNVYTDQSLAAQSNDIHAMGKAGLDRANADLSWQDFFGVLPREQTMQIPKPQEKYDLPEAYIGPNKFLTRVVIRLITEQEQFPVRHILPWRKHEGSISFGWNEFIFNNHMLTETPHEVPPRLLSSQKISRTESMKRYGIALILEHGFMLTEAGRLQYAMNLQQIANAVLNTCMFGVMTALVSSVWVPSGDPMTVYNSMYTRADFLNRLRIQKKFFAIIQKEEFGALQVVEFARAELQRRGVFDGNTIIWPDGAAKFANFSRPERKLKFYSYEGAPVNPERSLLSGVGGHAGITEFETSPILLGDGNGSVDPFYRPRTHGSLYMLTDRYLTSVLDSQYMTSMMTTKVYDEDRDAEVSLRPFDVWEAARPSKTNDTARALLRALLGYQAGNDMPTLYDGLHTMNGKNWRNSWISHVVTRLDQSDITQRDPVELRRFLTVPDNPVQQLPPPNNAGPAPIVIYNIDVYDKPDPGRRKIHKWEIVIRTVPSADEEIVGLSSTTAAAYVFAEIKETKQHVVFEYKHRDEKDDAALARPTFSKELFRLTATSDDAEWKDLGSALVGNGAYATYKKMPDGKSKPVEMGISPIKTAVGYEVRTLLELYVVDLAVTRAAAAAGGNAAANTGARGNKRRRAQRDDDIGIESDDDDIVTASKRSRDAKETRAFVERGLRHHKFEDLFELVDICVREDVRLPIAFLILQPHITHIMGSAVFCTRGERLGSTLYGHLDFQLADNAALKMHYGNFTMYTKPQIMDRSRLVLIPDVFARGYVGGGGTKFHYFGNSMHRAAYQQFDTVDGRDLFACIVPATYEPPEDLDITGLFANVEHDELHYPTAHVYKAYWGWNSAPNDVENLSFTEVANMPRVHNSVVSQGFQVLLSGDGKQPHFKLNKGVFGERVYEGCGDVRRGLSSVLKPINYSNTSTVLIEV